MCLDVQQQQPWLPCCLLNTHPSFQTSLCFHTELGTDSFHRDCSSLSRARNNSNEMKSIPCPSLASLLTPPSTPREKAPLEALSQAWETVLCSLAPGRQCKGSDWSQGKGCGAEPPP